MQQGQNRPRWVYATAVAGACFVAAPWFEWREPRSLPGSFDARSRTAELIVEAVARVDAACSTSDLDSLRALTTERYFGELSSLIGQSARRLDADASPAHKLHVGDVGALRLVLGSSASNPPPDGAPPDGRIRATAVVVFARRRAGFEHQADAGALFALRFAWDGFDLRLDGKASRLVRVGDLEAAVARELARELFAR